jgi:hypothetical protein
MEEDQDLTPAFMADDLEKFQDPKEADKLTKIQKDLDAIKEIMHKNIDEVLQRGENLDSLMEKSDDLSMTSVQFYKKGQPQKRRTATSHRPHNSQEEQPMLQSVLMALRQLVTWIGPYMFAQRSP